MNKKKFKLSAKINIPCQIEVKDPETETHGLLRLSNGDFCDFLNLAYMNQGKDILEKIEARTFMQFDLKQYKNFSLNGNFLDEMGFVEGEFYTGLWEEIILREIELSLIDTPFFYACDRETLKFSVGTEGESILKVESDKEGNLSVVSTIKHSDGKNSTAKRIFTEHSDGAEMIRRIYERIKDLVKSEDFAASQEAEKNKLAEQLNKTITESYIENK